MQVTGGGATQCAFAHLALRSSDEGCEARSDERLNSAFIGWEPCEKIGYMGSSWLFWPSPLRWLFFGRPSLMKRHSSWTRLVAQQPNALAKPSKSWMVFAAFERNTATTALFA